MGYIFHLLRNRYTLVAMLCLGISTPSPAPACTRAVYLGSNGDVITVRSMDWADDILTNLWILHRLTTPLEECCA